MSTSLPIRSHNPLTVRSPTLRSIALSREKAFSIGLKSGLYGGRKRSVGAGRFDPFLHGGPFVAREVVHDDCVARAQLGHQNLSHIGFEPIAVYRPVQHYRRDHSGHAQACDQCGGLAVAMREAHPQPLAFPAAPVTACHVGRDPGLVDEEEAFGFEAVLAVEPIFALPRDVEAVLLDRVAGLFCA